MCEEFDEEHDHNVIPVTLKQEFRFGESDIAKSAKTGSDKQARIEQLIIKDGAVYFKPMPNIGVHVETEKSTIFNNGHKESAWYKISSDFEVDFSSWADITLIRFMTEQELEGLDNTDNDYSLDMPVYGETLKVNVFSHHLRLRYTRIVKQLGGSDGLGKAAYIENPVDEYHLMNDAQHVIPPSSWFAIGGVEDRWLPKKCNEIIIT